MRPEFLIGLALWFPMIVAFVLARSMGRTDEAELRAELSYCRRMQRKAWSHGRHDEAEKFLIRRRQVEAQLRKFGR